MTMAPQNAFLTLLGTETLSPPDEEARRERR